MTIYKYGVNDADGRAYIYYNSPITSMYYYETAGEPWHAPTPGDGFYGIGRDGRFYDNGSPTGPTLNGTSFGTLIGGYNRKTWMTDVEPFAFHSASTDKMNMALIADDHVRHTSLVPLTDDGWARFLTSRQKWFLTGDFDVQVEFENRSVSGGSDGNTPMMRAFIDDNSWSYVRRRYNNTYDANTVTNNSWHSWGNVASTDAAGKLRMVRTGNIFRNYYWDGASWVLLHTSGDNAVLGLPIVLEVFVGGIGSLVVNSLDTFGFTINSGTVVNTAGWAREAAGDHRGSRADFPEKALIIATGQEVSIIDIENDKLWMRMRWTNGYALDNFGNWASTPKKVFMKNGRLVVGLNDGSSDGFLVTFDLTLDAIWGQRTAADSYTGTFKRCDNGIYVSPAAQGPRELSAYGMIRSRNRGDHYNGDYNNFQLLTKAVYATAVCQSGNKHYGATGCDTGISTHSWRQGYYDGDAATGYNFTTPQCVHHTLSARIVAIAFRRDTNELFYCTTTTIYSISLANLEAALVANPNGGSFTADSSAALPGTRSAAAQDVFVAHGGYVFVPRDEGVYRISWPAGTSELFYGDEDSEATHKVFYPWGKALSVSLLVDGGSTYVLIVGFETGVGAVNLATHVPYTTATTNNPLLVQA